jgi:hypothetical protein
MLVTSSPENETSHVPPRTAPQSSCVFAWAASQSPDGLGWHVPAAMAPAAAVLVFAVAVLSI